MSGDFVVEVENHRKTLSLRGEERRECSVDRYSLSFYNCVKIKNDIWFSTISYNGIYRYDTEKNYVERVAEFPAEALFVDTLYSKVCLYESLLIFIPANANKIAIFDIEKRMFRQVDIPCPYGVKSQNVNHPNFWEGVIYDGALFIIGYAQPVILRMDLKSYEVKVVYEVYKSINCHDNVYFGMQAAVCDNLLYIPCCYQNAVLILDMNCNDVFGKEIGKPGNRYIRIVNSDKNFYFISQNTDHVIFWDKSKNIYEEINIHFKKSCGDALTCINKEFVWIISAGEIYQICKLGNKIYRYIDMGNKFWIDCVMPYKEGICFENSITGEWYYIDNKGMIEKSEIKIKEPRRGKIWKQLKEEKVCIRESIYVPLQFFLCEMLEEKDCDLKTVFRSDKNKIWNKLCAESSSL